MANKKGGVAKFISVVLALYLIGSFMDLVSGPKIKKDTAYVKMNLYHQGAAKNKEWAESIWEVAQKEKVTGIIVQAKAEFVDSYGKSETVKQDIDITSLVSPLSEIRKYTQSKFADEFGDYIVDWVSSQLDR